MTFLDPAVRAVMGALINGAWLGLGLAALCAGWMRLASARGTLNATTRHVIWTTALAGVIGLTVLAGIVSLRGIEVKPTPTGPAEVQTSPVLESRAAPTPLPEPAPAPEPAPDPAPVAHSAPAPIGVTASSLINGLLQQGPVHLQPTMREVLIARVEGWIDAVNPGWPAVPDRVHWILPVSAQPWVYGLFGLWLLVAAGRMVRLMAGVWALRRLKQRARPLPPDLEGRAEGWLRRMPGRRNLTLAVSDGLKTPVAAGLGRPMILLPALMVDRLDAWDLEQIAFHEGAHLHRWDDAVQVIQRAAEAVLWCLPAVHWIGRHMDAEREKACDDWVVSLTQQPRAYAACLARLLKLNLDLRQPLLAPGLTTGTRQLFDRVQTLLDRNRRVSIQVARTRLLTVAGVLGGVLVLTAAMSPLVAVPGATTSAPPASPSRAVAPATPEAPIEPDAPAIAEAPAEKERPVESTVPTPPAPEPMRPNAPNASVPTPSPVSLSDEPRPDPALQQVRPTLSTASWIRLFQVASGLPSSGDRSEILTETAARMPGNEEIIAAYIESARGIPGPGDQKRTYLALLAHHRLDARTMPILLQGVEHIASSGDKTHVLIRIAEALPDDAAVHEAFLRALDTIPSSSDYTRAFDAYRQTRTGR